MGKQEAYVKCVQLLLRFSTVAPAEKRICGRTLDQEVIWQLKLLMILGRSLLLRSRLTNALLITEEAYL